jgi:hypothetical protein
MKIVNKKDFLMLESGTFFAKGIKWSFDSFCVKGESLEDDFFYTDLVSIKAFDSRQLADRQEEMIEKSTSYPIMLEEMRDGCFCDEDIFLIFEKEDLIKIRDLITITVKKIGSLWQ